MRLTWPSPIVRNTGVSSIAGSMATSAPCTTVERAILGRAARIDMAISANSATTFTSVHTVWADMSERVRAIGQNNNAEKGGYVKRR